MFQFWKKQIEGKHLYIHQSKSTCFFVPFDYFFYQSGKLYHQGNQFPYQETSNFEKCFCQTGNINNNFLKKVTNLTVSETAMIFILLRYRNFKLTCFWKQAEYWFTSAQRWMKGHLKYQKTQIWGKPLFTQVYS